MTTLPAATLTLQQNTRDEVRLVGGDGQIAGAISAEAGMHQQNYVVQQNAVGDPGTAIVAFQLTGDRNNPGVSTYDNVAPTIPANPMSDRGASVLIPNATVRRLTPTECERLQAFPDGWTDGQADTPRYKQLGNAVCVNVVEWIARRISVG